MSAPVVVHAISAGVTAWWLCAIGACSILLAASASARAATVSVETSPRIDTSDQVHYLAAAGERNQVVAHFHAEQPAGIVWTMSDPGAVITAGESCTSVDEHTVSCFPRPEPGAPDQQRQLFTARVELGDLEDELRFASNRPDSPGSVVASGGPGNDRLFGTPNDGSWLYGDEGDDELFGGGAGELVHGGAGNDRLFGGASDDRLVGGGGADELHGQGGRDELSDGDIDGVSGDAAPGPDLLDGGAGSDTASYRRRTEAVSVDLADPGRDGEPAEGDRLSSVENVIGGRGDDRLAGDDGDNVLRGATGRDHLVGRGGADVLDPGTGGGRVSCGSGRDGFPNGVTTLDFLQPDCEEIYDAPEGETPIFTAYPTLRRPDRVTHRITCPHESGDEGLGEIAECSGRVAVRAVAGNKRLLASANFPNRAWNHHKLTLQLTPLGRRLANRPGGARAEVRLRVRVASIEGTYRVTQRWTIRLEIPG